VFGSNVQRLHFTDMMYTRAVAQCEVNVLGMLPVMSRHVPDEVAAAGGP
jgi:hypothetical protein